MLQKSNYPAFPENFVWGVATSAYQIEGAAQEDGRADSIWDSFCRQQGVISDQSSGDIACDHYHRLEADLDLMASLGVDAYRFSISWSRVQPLGRGEWNPAGLAFYQRLLDGVAARNMKAYLTLNHWDLPQALQEHGGWANRDTVHAFVDYARGIAQHFGAQVASITTHNEPWVVATLGNELGIFAPGIKCRKTAMQVSHHLLLSHGLCLQALRLLGVKAELGIVLNQSPIQPASNSQADIDKAKLDDGLLVRWYMDPLLRGTYPEDIVQHLGSDMPMIEAGDMEAIATPVDFIGLNYYTRNFASADPNWRAPVGSLGNTAMDWEIYPQGLSDLLQRLKRDYNNLPPMLITENGAAFDEKVCIDPVDGSKSVHDVRRTEYLRLHIEAVADAMAAGVDVRGYFAWSLFDNFEWAFGYSKRFGLVYVDYDTQERIVKDSAIWYRDFLASRTPQLAA
jgi:beta-glucosidase